MMRHQFNEKWFMTVNDVCSPRATLVCFPYGGAGASVFVAWKKAFPDLRIVALKLPGREARIDDVFITDPHKLIELILEALPQALPAPLIFYGHSMGAAIAYLLTLALYRLHRKVPDLVIASGKEPLHRVHQNAIKDLDTPQLLVYLQALGGIDTTLPQDPQFLKQYVAKMQADYQLDSAMTLAQPTPIPVPLCILNAVDDPYVESACMTQWSQYTAYPLQAYSFTGGHFFMRKHFDDVMQCIKACIVMQLNGKKVLYAAE